MAFILCISNNSTADEYGYLSINNDTFHLTTLPWAWETQEETVTLDYQYKKYKLKETINQLDGNTVIILTFNLNRIAVSSVPTVEVERNIDEERKEKCSSLVKEIADFLDDNYYKALTMVDNVISNLRGRITDYQLQKFEETCKKRLRMVDKRSEDAIIIAKEFKKPSTFEKILNGTYQFPKAPSKPKELTISEVDEIKNNLSRPKGFLYYIVAMVFLYFFGYTASNAQILFAIICGIIAFTFYVLLYIYTIKHLEWGWFVALVIVTLGIEIYFFYLLGTSIEALCKRKKWKEMLKNSRYA